MKTVVLLSGGLDSSTVLAIAVKEGFKPYVNTIATFLTRRCFEQVAVDLCLHNLPVRLIGNGGGLGISSINEYSSKSLSQTGSIFSKNIKKLL